MIERSRFAFLRFIVSGGIFTFLGPAIFWLMYPLGPFVAIGVAELSVHTVRYITFRKFVFPASKGYEVSLQRYVTSALPTSVSGVVIVTLFRNRFDRNMLTLTNTLVAVIVGFLWSRYVYSKPAGGRLQTCEIDADSGSTWTACDTESG